MKHTRHILQTIVLAVALLAAGSVTAKAETVTLTFSGSTEQTGNVNLTIAASGSVSGSASTMWEYSSTHSISNISIDGFSISFASDKNSSMTVASGLVIEADANTGGRISLANDSKYIYHITIKNSNGVVLREGWNLTRSYTYLFKTAEIKTIVVEYASSVPFTDAQIGGISDSYPVSNVEVKPTPTVTWHGSTLEKNTHYTLSYQNNAAPGTATVTATSKGVFNGSSVSANYTLVWANYNVRFNKNSDSAEGTMSDQSFYYTEEKALTANAFTRTGYNFAGWTTKADGTGDSYTDGQSVSNLSATEGATVNLYARWTANDYTVTLDDQGATTAGSAEVTATYDAALPAITVPVRTNYIFGGYYSEANGGGTRYYNADGTSAHNWDIASATTLYAKWTGNTYTVTLDNQGATTAGSAEVTATYGAAMPAISVPAKTDCTFGGYYTEANGGGTKYYNADGTSARIWDITSATTLYAKWTVNPRVEYIDENGVGQVCRDYINLTGAETALGVDDEITWYAVSDDINFDNNVDLYGDVRLILTDGKKMTITVESNKPGILWVSQGSNNGFLSIYGQSGDTGSLEVTSKNKDGINVRSLTINGGTVVATGAGTGSAGIHAGDRFTINGGIVVATGNGNGIYSNITINGGTVVATGTYNCIYAYDDITINGGTVTATSTEGDGIEAKTVTIKGGSVTATAPDYGIRADKIWLSWTNTSDCITASSYSVNPNVTRVVTFTDGTNIYSGSLNREAIAGKTLRPYLDPDTSRAENLTLVQGTKDGVTAWWGTFYDSNNHIVLSEGAAAYTMDASHHLYRLGVDGRTVPKGTAVVIIATEATPVFPATSPATATIPIYKITTSTMTVTDHAPGGNILQGSGSDDPVDVASGKVTVDGEQKTPCVLGIVNGAVGFHPVANNYNGVIPANKAYYLK